MNRITPQEPQRMKEFRKAPEPSHNLTLAPQMLFLQQPADSKFTQPHQYLDMKPPTRWENVPFDPVRRSSVASSTSSAFRSVWDYSESPVASPRESKGSPASSATSYSCSQSEDPRPDISQMSAAPFCSSFSGIFGLTTECLACGYRYDTVDQLADHQRIDHGLADVIF